MEGDFTSALGGKKSYLSLVEVVDDGKLCGCTYYIKCTLETNILNFMYVACCDLTSKDLLIFES